MVYFVVITFKPFNSVVVVVKIIIPTQLQYEQFHDSGVKIDFLDSKIRFIIAYLIMYCNSLISGRLTSLGPRHMSDEQNRG